MENLTYIVQDEVLLITTEERAHAAVVVEMYRVDDLDHFGNASESRSPNFEAYSSLADAIVSCVEPESWGHSGEGEGNLALLRPGILVISNTPRVQHKVEEFLDELRHLRAEIEGEWDSSTSAEDDSSARQGANEGGGFGGRGLGGFGAGGYGEGGYGGLAE